MVVFRWVSLALLGGFTLCPQVVGAAKSPALGDFWTPLSPRPAAAGSRGSRAEWLHLDETGLHQYLSQLPKADAEGSLPLSLPLPEGGRREYEVRRSLVMPDELAVKFPEIQTFYGEAVDGSPARVRFELTYRGFSAMLFAPEGVSLIDPEGDNGGYVSYAHQRRANSEPFDCTTHAHPANDDFDAYATRLGNAQPQAVGATLRTYRTAIAATGEYTVAFGGSVGLALGGIVSAVNRINQIYETDLGLRLVLVPRNHLIVYTNGATDPYTNNNRSAMLTENVNTLNAVIGSSNYDFGHLFEASGGPGGVAALGSICTAAKARGVSGMHYPNFDAFWIGYVAHEMGHQLGASHTFNGTSVFCGGNRSASNAYEVGSGSTIMAYPGGCGLEGVQNDPDPYFHVASLASIHNFTQTGSGSTCGTLSNTGNNPPTLTATPAATIPARTPFMLTAIAVDPDGDPLTYVWEQFNLDPTGSNATTVNQDNGLRPLFRSFAATSSPIRLFPRIESILSATQTIGEVMPTTNRTLRFRVTARDNRFGGGGVQWTGTTMPAIAQTTLSIVDTGVGFAISAFNAETSVAAGSLQPLTWDVAGTTANGINCANVDIAWSVDGGYQFAPLIAATANDGTQGITIPSQATAAARVRVACSTNIFFDINNANIAVTGGNAAPLLTLTAGTVYYTTNGPAVLLDAAAVISDDDSADFDGAKLTVNFINNGEANDRLEVRNEGTSPGQVGISGSTVSFGGTPIGLLAGGSGVLPLIVTFNAAAQPAAAQAVLRNVTYRNVSAVAGTLTRTVGAIVTDGDGGSSTRATRNISIGVNANPFIALIDDGDADNLIPVNAATIYVVQFSKDVNLASIDAADFDNAGTATIAIGAITEPSAGVINFTVTPSSAGTLTLRAPASATIIDASGLAVPVPVQDNDTLMVVGDGIFYDGFD